MAPQSAKPLERIPGTLFEREELPPPEVVDGCLSSVIIAHDRLADVLELAPPGTARGIMLDRALISAEKLLKTLREARRVQLLAAWRR